MVISIEFTKTSTSINTPSDTVRPSNKYNLTLVFKLDVCVIVSPNIYIIVHHKITYTHITSVGA